MTTWWQLALAALLGCGDQASRSGPNDIHSNGQKSPNVTSSAAPIPGPTTSSSITPSPGPTSRAICGLSPETSGSLLIHFAFEQLDLKLEGKLAASTSAHQQDEGLKPLFVEGKFGIGMTFASGITVLAPGLEADPAETLCAWIRPDQTVYPSGVRILTSGDGDYFGIGNGNGCQNDGYVPYAATSLSCTPATAPLSIKVYHHLCWVLPQGGVGRRLVIDGIATPLAYVPATAFPFGRTSFRIAEGEPVFALDDISLWSVPLLDEDVARLYADGRGCSVQ